MNVANEKNFENMLILSSGKLFGFCLSFMIPFFLSRWLTIEDYGTYKQLILIWMIFMQVQNLGMDLGLFYFVKTYPKDSPILSINVMIVNLFTTLMTVAVLGILSETLANVLHNPGLATYIPSFSLVLIFSIPSQHFENYLISLGKIKWAFVLEGIHEIAKSCIILAGFLFFNSLRAVLLMLATLYMIKLTILLWYNLRAFKKQSLDISSGVAFLMKQVLYGFPLGIARIISALIYFDKLIISFMYSVTQFAIYSVGCFEIPFIRTMLNTMWELTSLEMVAAHNSKDSARLVSLMRDTMRKVSIIAIPIAIFGIIFAQEVIVGFFSSTYMASVPYFKLFMLVFLVNSFDCELLFRVFKANKIFLKIQILNLILTMMMMIILGLTYGPLGALVGKVISSAVSLAIMFKNVRRPLGVTLSEFVPIDIILWITVLCTVLGYSLLLVGNLAQLNGLTHLILSACLYFTTALLIFASLGIISEMEKEYFKRKILLLNIFAKQRTS
ncbi:MAG: hypothetical protein A2X86_13950 [Bdellovibrionales bacterium GWA2_49_15]|nr:MAG: hypothetical protein A2X86_13950 [Bdellovibrionales bacterium GWA2_49_15]HAZ13632.1 hypothetical protein [Bdellovibrionales bacterium]